VKVAPGWLPLVPILVGFVAVATAYSVVVPLLEAPDEPSHVAFVRYLRTHNVLPSQEPRYGYPVGQEGSQPPLYYAVGALLWRLAPGPDLAPTWASHNPFVTFDRSTEPAGNRNFYAHTAAEEFPYRGDVLAIHLVRLLSVALGALTVALTYGTARALFPGRWLVAPLAAGIVAFDPQFAFISGVVNNDNAIAATSTLVLALSIRWWNRGGSRRLELGLGLALAAALLSKSGGLLLVIPVGIVFVLDLVRRRNKADWKDAAIVALVAFVAAAWWFARNEALYGDPIGWSAMLRANGAMLRANPLDPLKAAQVIWQARGTFWGTFGWTNVLFDGAVYRLLDVVTAIAGIGVLVSLRRIRLNRPWRDWIPPATVLVVWPALVFASLIRWVQLNEAADQWRLLFPAIVSLAILLALGFDEVVALAVLAHSRIGWKRDDPHPLPAGRGRPQPGEGSQTPSRSKALPVTVGFVLTLAGLAANAIVLTLVIAARYYPVLAAASDATGSAPVRFGPDVELVQYQVSPDRIAPGQPVDVDLLWRARSAPARNWAVSLAMTGENGAPLALARSWPQAGSAPTTAWRPGLLYRDHYRLIPTWRDDQPDLAPVWLSLYDASNVGVPSPPVTDSNRHPAGTGIVLDRVKLAPTDATAPPTREIQAKFGQSIELVGYDSRAASGGLQIALHWRDLAAVGAGYTVFVHVTDASGKVVAQHDGPPRGGRYPTDKWAPGETILDPHTVDGSALAPGRYRVLVGMYLPDSGQRLPVEAGLGVSATSDEVLLMEWDRS
jgi:hypothetical protein